MKNKTGGRRRTLFLGVGGVLVFFALLSVLHMSKSYHVYTAARQRMDDAYGEKAYVEKQLDDLRTHTQRKRYDAESTGITSEEKLKKIELRGAELSPGKNRPFSEREERFNVIEQ